MKRRVSFILSFILCFSLCLPSVSVYADSNTLQFGTNESFINSDAYIDYNTYRYSFGNSETGYLRIFGVPNSFIDSLDMASFLDESSFAVSKANSIWYYDYNYDDNSMWIHLVDITGFQENLINSCWCNTNNNTLGLLFDTDVGSLTMYNYKFVNGTWEHNGVDNTLNRNNKRVEITYNTSNLKFDTNSVEASDYYSYAYNTGRSFIWGNVLHVYSAYEKYSNLSWRYSTPYGSFSYVCLNEDNFHVLMGGEQGTIDAIGYDYFQCGNVAYYNGTSIVQPGNDFDYSETTTNNLIAFNDADLITLLDSNNNNLNCRFNWSMDTSAFDYSSLPNNWKMNYSLRVDYSFYKAGSGILQAISPNIKGSVVFQWEDDIGSYQNIQSGQRLIILSDLLNGSYGNTIVNASGQHNSLKMFTGIISAISIGDKPVDRKVDSSSGNKLNEIAIKVTNISDFIIELYGEDYFNIYQGIKDILGLTQSEAEGTFSDAVGNVSYVINQLDYNLEVNAYNTQSGDRSRNCRLICNNITYQNSSAIEPADNTGETLPVTTTDNNYLIPSGDGNYYLMPSVTGGSNSNNVSVNLSTPDNIKLFIDNGFQNFLTWYETSADTAYATNRFWSSMGIFEDNPATELYSEYFGFLPDDFKTLILSCAGIGIVGGAFCILRRRLH